MEGLRQFDAESINGIALAAQEKEIEALKESISKRILKKAEKGNNQCTFSTGIKHSKELVKWLIQLGFTVSSRKESYYAKELLIKWGKRNEKPVQDDISVLDVDVVLINFN